MSQASATVYVVDDDESIRKALERQLRSAGYVTKNSCGAGKRLKQVMTYAVRKTLTPCPKN